MKIFLALSITLITFITLSCTNDVISNNEKNSNNRTPFYQSESSNINRHFCDPPDSTPHCRTPARACFDDVIVTAPHPAEENEILTQHINNNTVYLYFDEGNIENYEVLFPGFEGPALIDLRNDLTTLRKIPNGDTTIVTYYIVYTADTNSRPDYSDYY